MLAQGRIFLSLHLDELYTIDFSPTSRISLLLVTAAQRTVAQACKCPIGQEEAQRLLEAQAMEISIQRVDATASSKPCRLLSNKQPFRITLQQKTGSASNNYIKGALEDKETKSRRRERARAIENHAVQDSQSNKKDRKSFCLRTSAP